MSWLYSQALVEEYSAANFSDGEPSAQLNVMPTQHQFWRNDKMMDHSKLSRFGLTLKLLTEADGEALLTSYLAVFPAKTSAVPEQAQASPANDRAYGEKWRASFAKCDPAKRSLKTAQCSLLEDSNESCVTWPKWGSMRNGVCSEQTIAVPRTFENESGFWPTPKANDAQKRGNFNLEDPRNGLPAAAKKWPTPTAAAAKGSSPKSLRRKNGRSRINDRIDHAVMSSDNGQLNPTWVEWLMGWPLEWTDLKPLATAKYQEWLQQHSSCSDNELKASNHQP